MKPKIDKNRKEYDTYLNWVDTMFDKKINHDTPEGENSQIFLLLIKQYEDEHHAIPYPEPIEAIKMKMQERGIKIKDLVGKIGSKSYVSAILNKHKPLTLEIAKVFHKELGIPAEILLT